MTSRGRPTGSCPGRREGKKKLCGEKEEKRDAAAAASLWFLFTIVERRQRPRAFFPGDDCDKRASPRKEERPIPLRCAPDRCVVDLSRHPTPFEGLRS
jgi:hypothetical protein